MVFWMNEEKIFDLINQLQDLEKFDEANRIAHCNEYILIFLKLSLLIISLGDALVFVTVSMFGHSEYRLVLPWIFQINCDVVYYITYVIQVVQVLIIMPVYISIETLPFGLMLLLEAHIKNIGIKVSKIGWDTDKYVEQEEENPVIAKNEYLSTVLIEDRAKKQSLSIINAKVNEQQTIHNEYYQEDGAEPSTSTGISTMSRDYMKNPWNSRGNWGPSPETSDNTDNSNNSDGEDKDKEGCKDVMDFAIKIKDRIIFDEFIKPRISFVRRSGACQPSPFVMPTKPIKSQIQASDNKPTTSMEDLLKHCINYQVQIFKYT